MKNYAFVAIVIVISQNVFAQIETILPKQNEQLNYKYSLKLYNQTGYQQVYKLINIQPALVRFRKDAIASNILRPTIALQWKDKQKNFHEIELNRFNIDKQNSEQKLHGSNGQYITVDGEKTINTNISLRYEYILQFCKGKNARLIPAIGFGINPYYERQNYIPKTSNNYPQSLTETGIRTFIVPRLSYFFSKKFFCDLNVPLCINNFSYLYNTVEDPSLNAYHQKGGLINAEMFPKLLSARIGIGMKL